MRASSAVIWDILRARSCFTEVRALVRGLALSQGAGSRNRDRISVSFSCAPSGLVIPYGAHLRLSPRALFLRRFAAGSAALGGLKPGSQPKRYWQHWKSCSSRIRLRRRSPNDPGFRFGLASTDPLQWRRGRSYFTMTSVTRISGYWRVPLGGDVSESQGED